MLHTPSGGAPVGTAAGAVDQENGPMSIGAVLQALRAEFPEVTVSKIRFLEAEGLVEPARSPSGYRRFGAEDVERLSCILRMQRDHYLPLKVIREQLEGVGPDVPFPGAPASAEGLPVPGEGSAAPAGAAALPAVRMSREELLEATGAAAEELAAWEEYGLLGADEDGTYGQAEVTVAHVVARLGRHGLEARHLRALKICAEGQRALAEQRVAPLRRHPDARIRKDAAGTAEELAALSARLYTAFVQAAADTAGD